MSLREFWWAGFQLTSTLVEVCRFWNASFCFFFHQHCLKLASFERFDLILPFRMDTVDISSDSEVMIYSYIYLYIYCRGGESSDKVSWWMWRTKNCTSDNSRQTLVAPEQRGSNPAMPSLCQGDSRHLLKKSTRKWTWLIKKLTGRMKVKVIVLKKRERKKWEWL